MSKYETLLFLHVTGAFFFLGGGVVAWAVGIAAARRRRPSEVALLLRLARVAAALFGVGLALLLIFGIWIALDEYALTDGWILASLLGLIGAIVLGGIGGGRDKRTRMLAERLAREGDEPSAELDAAVRDLPALLLNLGSTLLGVAILALMIFKPGADSAGLVRSRLEEWELPLFLHVLGAVLLAGGVAAIAVLIVRSFRQEPDRAALLRRLAFLTTLVAVWPSFLLMRLAGQWIADEEGFKGDDDPGWVGIGYMVGDGGVLLLALTTIFGWLAWRRTRPDGGPPAAARVVAVLAPLYLLALGVAWFAMTTKTPS